MGFVVAYFLGGCAKSPLDNLNNITQTEITSAKSSNASNSKPIVQLSEQVSPNLLSDLEVILCDI